jgi:Holliday junction resolvasome RuvABC DNA-binding subunit
VGKKMALKIIIELKKDVDAHMLLPASGEIPLAPVHHHDVLDTLVGMGYDRRKVEQILANLPEEITSLQDMTVYCLRQLSAR